MLIELLKLSLRFFLAIFFCFCVMSILGMKKDKLDKEEEIMLTYSQAIVATISFGILLTISYLLAKIIIL